MQTTYYVKHPDGTFNPVDVPAASVQPEAEKMACIKCHSSKQPLRADCPECGGTRFAQRPLTFSNPADAEAVQPDSGRDAALVDLSSIATYNWGNDGMEEFGHQNGEYFHADTVREYLAAHPANVAQVGELSDAKIDRIATEYAMDGTMLHGSRSLMYARSFARAIIAAMSAPAKTDKG